MFFVYNLSINIAFSGVRMPSTSHRQLTKGLILLSGLLLIVACAEPRAPYSVVHEADEAELENSVKAIIPATPTPTPTETITYEPEYPQTYIVQEGDTLWDISSVFLRDPWYWPEIWFKNPQVENPHLILYATLRAQACNFSTYWTGLVLVLVLACLRGMQ